MAWFGSILLWVSGALADQESDSRTQVFLRDQASLAVRTMEGNAARIQRMWIEARVNHREAETTCLDRALSRADSAVRAGREEDRLAIAALDAGDVVNARHQVGLILGQREASRIATRFADRCLMRATEPAESDQTTVRLILDRALPPDAVVFSL